MNKNESVINDFESVLPTTPGWVVVHSSLIHLNIESESFKWLFLKKIKEYANKGYTFAFPSFTFSFCKKGYFDKQLSHSETGILADWVAELYDATRTDHPIYSHVVIGKNAQQGVAASSVSCFGETSIYQLFEMENATLCMLGCAWSFCTSFHYFENKFKVPYRYNKTFSSQTNPNVIAQMYVRDLSINPTNYFMPAVNVLNQHHHIKKGKTNTGHIESVSFNALAQVCNQQLSENLYCYVKNAHQVSKQVLDKIEANAQPIITVVVLANHNFEPIAGIFSKKFSSLCSSRNLDFYQNSYDQMYSDVYSGKIKKISPDYCFLPSRLEDIYKVSELEFANLKHDVLNDYIDLIIKLNDLVNRTLFIHLFPVLNHSSAGAVLMESGVNLYAFIQQANRQLIEKTQHLKQVKLLAPEMLSSEPLLFDPRQWYLGKIPYSNKVLESFASYYCGLIMSAIGKHTRLIIVDLDNTLWGGVLGEEGIEGISLGGDFPGNAYKDFQSTMMALKKRGIILAVVSKNDEEVALQCINKHPDMLIKTRDLVAYKINWKEKHINIKSIANEVGLDDSNILFIDDNPVEREKIKKHLPNVHVLELPDDPVLYRQTLLNFPLLAVTDITLEDKKRADSYLKRREFNALLDAHQVHDDQRDDHQSVDHQNRDHKSQGHQSVDHQSQGHQSDEDKSIHDFLTRLKMEVKINKLDDLNFSRALQLIHKTNQFNTTTKRYSEAALKKMQRDPSFVISVVAYQDRTTENENIGVFILKRENTQCTVDLFLLSCRVLGRQLENAIMAWIMNSICQQGIRTLIAEVVETSRNTPVRDLYKNLGFLVQEEGRWLIQTSEIIKSPHFIKISGSTS